MIFLQYIPLLSAVSAAAADVSRMSTLMLVERDCRGSCILQALIVHVLILCHTTVGCCYPSIPYEFGATIKIYWYGHSSPVTSPFILYRVLDWLLLISSFFLFLPKWYSGIPLVPIVKVCLSFQSAVGFTQLQLHLHLPPSCSSCCTSKGNHRCKLDSLLRQACQESNRQVTVYWQWSQGFPQRHQSFLRSLILVIAHRGMIRQERKGVNTCIKPLHKPQAFQLWKATGTANAVQAC